MTIARDTILSPGVYWIDHDPDKTPNFNTWLASQKGLVVVLRSELQTRSVPSGGFLNPLKPARLEWVLFEVKFPAMWDKRLGFPSTAPRGRDTDRSDVHTAPSTPGLFDTFDLSSAFQGGSGLLLLALAYFALKDRD